MNADYIYWYPLDKMEIRNIILVKENNDTDPERAEERTFFEEITVIGKIKNKYAREVGTKVYLLKSATVPINPILEEEIREKRNHH
jgi:hypothetical protein